jgi:hypothetical protein
MGLEAKRAGYNPQLEAQGLEIVRLHQKLKNWRDLRRLAYAEGWPALAAQIIEIEICAMERDLARHVQNLF